MGILHMLKDAGEMKVEIYGEDAPQYHINVFWLTFLVILSLEFVIIQPKDLVFDDEVTKFLPSSNSEKKNNKKITEPLVKGSKARKEQQKQKDSLAPILLLFSMSIHSTISGVALGIQDQTKDIIALSSGRDSNKY